MSLEAFGKLPEEKRELITSTGIRAFAHSSFRDVSTDAITRECQISKGLLFHYFGSKREYYRYCLERSMERLTQRQEETREGDFYGILFASMDRRMTLCRQYYDEMHMVNMASRDPSAEIVQTKTEVLQRYSSIIQSESMRTLERALAALLNPLRNDGPLTVQGLRIYVNALLNQYLLQYQEDPDVFFGKSDEIKGELKNYLDLMLYGICK